MIHRSIEDDSPGSRSAAELAERIAREWPDVARSARDEVHLFTNVLCFGQSAVELDLVVLFRLAAPRAVPGTPGWSVRSGILVIEEKAHPPERVEFAGASTFVRYDERLLNATRQARNQAFALRDHIAAATGRRHWIDSLVWLTNVEDVPATAGPAVGARAGWNDFLGRLSLGRWKLRDLKITEEEFAALRDVLGRRIRPSGLERTRMERISQGHLDGQKYAERIGEQLLVFRGQGGTGKTVTLMRIARDLAVTRGKRVLLLTYNRALVGDLSRIRDLMRREQPEMKRVGVQSHMSFFRGICAKAGVLRKGDDYLGRYRELLERVTRMLTTGEISIGGDEMNWDCGLIDEAQDWEPYERDLLYALFGPDRLVLADGMTQLVRSHERLEWREHPNVGASQVVTLRKGLRLKRNLAHFVTRFAKFLEHGWEVDVVPDLVGGRVIVLEGEPHRALRWCAPLIRGLQEEGTSPVDLLVCVPPELVELGRCSLAPVVRSMGYGVWDGCDPHVRASYPVDRQQIRLIQYDSCRGLEGWAVFAFGLDAFWDYKRKSFKDLAREKLLFDTAEIRARRSCTNWLMIPLTRAIHTLVLQVSRRDHEVTGLLRRVAAEMPDVVTWIDLNRPPHPDLGTSRHDAPWIAP